MDRAIPRRAIRIPELDGLMVAAVILTCLGLVMYLSVITTWGRNGEPETLAKALQDRGIRMICGIIALLVMASAPLHLLRRYAHWIFLAGVALCLVAMVIGTRKGAGRWIPLGPFTFQPVEMARFGLVLLIARILADAGPAVRRFREGFVSVLAPAALLSVVLVFQPDNGNALFCTALACAMALVGRVPMRWFLCCGAPAVLALWYAIQGQGHVQGRLANWPDVHAATHVGQGLVAISAGGAFGQGLGNGDMKLGFVTESSNDFVFAMIGEELGFLGSFAVVGLFAWIAWIGFRLTIRAQDPFCALTIFGFAFVLCFQALINMCVATGLAPAKGIDLPFVSSGGTSLMTCFAAVGVIGNAARTDRCGESSLEPAYAG